MLTADVLKRQKLGLMLRLSEQKRELSAAQERVAQLSGERDAWAASVAVVAQAWAELDANLANFAARLAPLGSAGNVPRRMMHLCSRACVSFSQNFH